jgi:protocatechuate 3,4-dioxygenase alpha subunit
MLIYTPSQTVGPFYSTGLLWEGSAEAVEETDPESVEIRGILADGDGPFVYPEGLLEFWSPEQLVRVQTDGEGAFRVRLRRPRAAPPLDDGRSQAPHVNVNVFGRGLLKALFTRMYFPDEALANASDPVLELVPEQRRHSLIATGEPDGTLRFDIRVQGEREGVFFSL